MSKSQKSKSFKQSSYVDNEAAIPVVATALVAEPYSLEDISPDADYSANEVDSVAKMKPKRKPSISSSSSHSTSKIGVENASVSTGGMSKAPSYTKHKDISFSVHKPNAIKPWPPALRDAVVRSFKRQPDEQSGLKFLSKHDWPTGLSGTVFKSCKKIAIRFFIVDDSGSMILNDGKRVIQTGGTCK